MSLPTDIRHQVEELIRIFEAAGYSGGDLQNKKDNWNAIVKRHLAQGLTQYEQSVIDDYINTATWKRDVALRSENHVRQMIRCARYLEEYNESGTVVPGRIRFLRQGLGKAFEALADSALDNADWNEGARREIRGYANSFFQWMQERDIDCVDDIDEGLVLAYFNEKRFTKKSLYAYRSGLKKFFARLYENGQMTKDLREAFSFKINTIAVSNKEKAATPCAPETDAGIDTPDARGKAILLLGAELHLRPKAISDLMTTDFDRDKQILKTGDGTKTLSKALTDAIADYIDNARPESNDPHLFLRLRSPFTKISRTSCASILNYKKM